MTTPAAQTSRLMQATEAAYAAEQANMSLLARREIQLRLQIADLNAARIAQDQQIEADYAKRIGADFLWQGWVDSRLSKLNAELARTLLARERARAKLTLAFGKYQIAGHLYEQARLNTKKLREKRAERNA